MAVGVFRAFRSQTLERRRFGWVNTVGAQTVNDQNYDHPALLSRGRAPTDYGREDKSDKRSAHAH